MLCMDIMLSAVTDALWIYLLCWTLYTINYINYVLKIYYIKDILFKLKIDF